MRKLFLFFGLSIIWSVSATAQQVSQGLTVLMNFPSDARANVPRVHGFSNAQAQDVERMLNQRGYFQHGNSGSFRDYFINVSRGKLDIENTVVIVDMPNSLESYVADHIPSPSSVSDWTLKTDSLNLFSVQRSERFHGTETARMPGLAGGPFFEMARDALCRIFGEHCDPGETVGYRVVRPSIGISSEFLPLQDTFFKNETLIQFDWLDYQLQTGGKSATYAIQPSILEHFGFVQFLIDIEDVDNFSIDSSTGARSTFEDRCYPEPTGECHGEGMWPRSLPLMLTIDDTPIGRPVILPINGASPIIGTMVHEAGHALFGLKDLYDPHRSLDYVVNTSNNSIEHGQIGDIFDDTVWYKSSGAGNYALMGSNHETKPQLMNAMNRELVGWEQPFNLIDAREGTVYKLVHPAGRDAVPERLEYHSLKYCRPNSLINECFYLESAKSQVENGIWEFFTPETGVKLWKYEFYNNPFDFAPNQREDRTAGLHFDVSLVQADGLYSLEAERSTGASPSSGNLFQAGSVFNSSFNPDAFWWDGVDSGIDFTVLPQPNDYLDNWEDRGDWLIEIGSRPLRPISIDFDEDDFDIQFTTSKKLVTTTLQQSAIYEENAGELFRVDVTPSDNNRAYCVYNLREHKDYEDGPDIGFDTDQHFSSRSFFGTVTYNINSIKIVYCDDIRRRVGPVDIYLDEGVSVINHVGKFLHPNVLESDSPILNLGSTRSDVSQSVSIVDNYDPVFHSGKVPTHITDMKNAILLEEFDTHMVTGWEIHYGDSSFGIPSDVGQGVAIGLDWGKVEQYYVADPNQFSKISIVVNTARRNNSLCNSSNVEQWRWDGEYSNVGVLVADDGAVYSANVPRATILENRRRFDDLPKSNPLTAAEMTAINDFHSNPPFRPDDFPEIWSKIEVCSVPARSCASIPEFSPLNSYIKGTQVQHDGKIWELMVDQGIDAKNETRGREFPGSYSHAKLAYRGVMDSLDESEKVDLGVVSLNVPFEGHISKLSGLASWEAVGNCSN